MHINMNAQVNTQANPAGLLDALRDGTAKVIAAVKAQKKDGDKTRADRESAIETVRAMAVTVASINASPEAAKAAATYMAATMKAAGVKTGTAEPYALALRGFIYEAGKGKDIRKYTEKADGKFNPLSVAEAQRIARWEEMTDSEREAAKAETERQEIIADLTKRLKEMDTASLTALRDSGMIPEVEEPEETESAEDKRRREAAEKAERERAEAEAALANAIATAEPVAQAEAA